MTISVKFDSVNRANVTGARGYKPFDIGIDPWGLSEVITRYSWSPMVFRNNYRLIKNFIESSWCALDFDGPDTPLCDAIRKFCDMTHVIGTTRNHQKVKDGKPACDRYRVCIPWEEKITTIANYSASLTPMIERCGADNQSKDPARLFFPCREIVSINYGSYNQEVIKVSSEKSTEPIEETPFVPTHNGLCRRTVRFLTLGTASEEFATPHRNTSAYKAALDLIRNGYDEKKTFYVIRSAIKDSDFEDSEILTIIKSAVNGAPFDPFRDS